MKIHSSFIIFGACFLGACGSSNTDPNPVPTDGGADASADATKDSTSNEGGADTTPAETTSETTADSTGDTTTTTDADAAETSASCLPTSGAGNFDAYFTLMDATKCVVAQYDVPAAPVMTLTWGRHGGPLGFDGSDPTNVKVVRWTAPTAATGTLTKSEEAHAISSLPSGSIFFASQALDLPFFDWTAISYTTTATASSGELLLVQSATSDAVARYDVNGFFSETVVGTSSGRLFYTGLSPISTTASTTSAGGLYYADSCGDASSPRLVPAGDATCSDPSLMSTWQAGSSGPVATDANDDLFAILSTAFGGNEELRGFHHAYTSRGAAKNDGTTLSTDKNFTNELAADGAQVYFQESDGTTYAPLDVQTIPYTVDDTAKTVTGSSAPKTFLKLATPGTAVALLVDDKHRLWVGVAKPATGDAGATASTFFVLDKKP